MEPEGVPGAVVGGAPHHLLGEWDVAAVLAGQLADVRRSVVDHLTAEILGESWPFVVIGVDEPMFVGGAIASTSAA